MSTNLSTCGEVGERNRFRRLVVVSCQAVKAGSSALSPRTVWSSFNCLLSSLIALSWPDSDSVMAVTILLLWFGLGVK